MRRRVCVVTVAVTTILAGALLFGQAGAADVRMGGTFVMNDITFGLLGDDLLPLVGSENSWTIVLRDVWFECEEVFEFEATLRASSFEFNFFGPDAELLNSVVAAQLTQGALDGDGYFKVLCHPEVPQLVFIFYIFPDVPEMGVTWSVDGYASMDEFPPDSLGCPTIGEFGINAQHTTLVDRRGMNSGILDSFDASDIWLESVTPLSESTWGTVKALHR